jgi:hypothetical protein
VIRSITLGVTPTARQAQAILAHIEEELRTLGALVQRSPYGAVHFRLPPPWRARHFGILHVVTSGRATIGAAVGSPWRVRYELKFRGLQLTAALLSLLVIGVALRTGEFISVWALLAIWLGLYGIPYVAATIAFRRLVEARIRALLLRAPNGAASTEQS